MKLTNGWLLTKARLVVSVLKAEDGEAVLSVMAMDPDTKEAITVISEGITVGKGSSMTIGEGDTMRLAFPTGEKKEEE